MGAHRAGDRAVHTSLGVVSRRSLVGGAHGVLLACNDDIAEPGAGYDAHPHRDLDIVTWVVEGELTHEDATGRVSHVPAGWVQLLVAGSGIEHAERNLDSVPVRFVQFQLAPKRSGVQPSYVVAEAVDRAGRLVPVATVGPHATLHAASLEAGASVTLPEAPFLFVFVVSGRIVVEGEGELAEGDDARLVGIGGQRVTAARATELLVWAMEAAIAGVPIAG